MNKLVLSIAFVVACLPSVAQKSKRSSAPQEMTIPMTAAAWDFPNGGVEFLNYKGTPALKILNGGIRITVKDLKFADGTIEFDVEPVQGASVYFHRKDDKEQEIVYLRLGAIGNKLAYDAIQYAPYLDGANMWDMYPKYQGPAPIKKDDWNHMKLVMAGKQMRVYMNQQIKPVLEIPKLEGNFTEGSIAFDGVSYIANVIIKPNEKEDIPTSEGVDLTNHDANYLRRWAISKPVVLPQGSEAYLGNQAKLEDYTDSISAEREGFVNLSRKLGGNSERKVVWLKTKITAKNAVKAALQLGFSDEVWVFLNNQTVYVDKNLYPQNMRKYPNGRMSIENARIDLNLKQGDNELMLAVANNFYGWGIAARLTSTESITELDQISGITKLAREISNVDLDVYPGVYSTSSMPMKLTFTKKDKTLMVQPTGQPELATQAQGNHLFRVDQAGVVFEFRPADKKLLLRQGGQTTEFSKE